jgi:hypothetical protein
MRFISAWTLTSYSWVRVMGVRVVAVAYVQRVECRRRHWSTIYLMHHDLESLSDAANWRLRKLHYFINIKFGCLSELVQPW